MAQREVGLSAGEPPPLGVTRLACSRFAPRLLERAGSSDVGSITGLYTVLVEGDDMNEPIGDSARSILDGHIVPVAGPGLARSLPRIEVLESLSRVNAAITSQEQRAVATGVPAVASCLPRGQGSHRDRAPTWLGPTRWWIVRSNGRDAMARFLCRPSKNRVTPTTIGARWRRSAHRVTWDERYRFRLEQVLRVRRVQESSPSPGARRPARGDPSRRVVEERLDSYHRATRRSRAPGNRSWPSALWWS